MYRWVWLAVSVAWLYSAAPVAAQAVAQAYMADGPLQRGMIVQFTSNAHTQVKALPYGAFSQMAGVVVAANDSPVTLSAATGSRQVYVATAGRYDVLVSDQGGHINGGDYITISSLDGVGMKADTRQPIILGKAAGSFDGTSAITTATLKNNQGRLVTVRLGLVPVDVNITRNPHYDGGSFAPSILRDTSASIAGKPVSTVRIYAALAVLLISFIVAGSILYAGVRTSLAAIGRNPLARRSVMRSLFGVIVTSVIILILGTGTVYLLLKL